MKAAPDASRSSFMVRGAVDGRQGRVPALISVANWLDRPLAPAWSVLGWLATTGVFVGLTCVLGGMSHLDAVESAFSTWAIAHGRLSCAYPPGSVVVAPFIAPLYPLLSGVLASLAHIGHGVPFPSPAAMGPHCTRAVDALSGWSARAGAIGPTVQLGYLGWLGLMGGAVALLRSAGRGRCGWEPVTLVVLAAVPPVLATVQVFFHPQDLLAMGLLLSALACIRTERWVWAGVLFGLAVATQQFALLVLAPMLLVSPPVRRVRFGGAACASYALVVAPLLVATSGRVLQAALLGSGDTASVGGTLISDLRLRGFVLVATSRILPILLAMLLAGWAARRLGPAVFEPIPLVSLVATSLCLRLVFEQNLFGYYFMAVAVALVLLDVVRGRIGLRLVAWLALVLVAVDPLSSGRDPLSLVALPLWLVQVVLVAVAMALAVGPLLETVKRSSTAHVPFLGTPGGASKGSEAMATRQAYIPKGDLVHVVTAPRAVMVIGRPDAGHR